MQMNSLALSTNKYIFVKFGERLQKKYLTGVI